MQQSRRSLLRTLGVSTAGLGVVGGFGGVASATRDPTDWDTYTEAAEIDDGELGGMVSTVTGFDSFQSAVDEPRFSASASFPLSSTENGMITVLEDVSVEVTPVLVPDEDYAPEFRRYDGIHPYRTGDDHTREEGSSDVLEYGLDLVWSNLMDRFSPISVPSPFGVSPDSGPSISQNSWKGNKNAAFTAAWNGELETHPDTANFAVDFYPKFPRAGDDGGAPDGMYIYDVDFKAEINNNLGSDDLWNRHTISFTVG
ncbi:hypothetical protein [Halorussus litoreus]|uniref:hypothetical protein n=1 Tax=Halorussus litoreus TaxID=1710536 RepID=UPI000E22C2C1|nr:hypothetical protein [Halorussus litoreus]